MRARTQALKSSLFSIQLIESLRCDEPIIIVTEEFWKGVRCNYPATAGDAPGASQATWSSNAKFDLLL
jgi:hypothetical protein